MKTPHKNADLIKAWADGAEIEFRWDCLDDWRRITAPRWDQTGDYRIKPEPKPDVVRYSKITFAGWDYISNYESASANLKLIFDGDTGELKDAEVIA